MAAEETSAGTQSSRLAGRVVVLTAQRRAAELATVLERHGALVEHAPTLSVVPHANDPQLLAVTRELVAAPPDVVVITTGVGVRGWLEAATAAGMGDALHAVLSDARVIARGAKSGGALLALGVTPDWVAESETSAEIRHRLLSDGVTGLRIAVQHHGAGADGLDEALAGAGAEIRPLVVYRWGPAPDPAAVGAAVRRVADRTCDAVVFTSAPGAAAFLEAAARERRLDDVVASCAGGAVLAAAVGATTAAPLQEVGIPVRVPSRFRLGALARLLVDVLAARPPR